MAHASNPSAPCAARPAHRRVRRWRPALAFALALAPLASAATLQVTTLADELDLIPNGACSLREAIVSANENRDVGGCRASGTYGTDTIVVPAGTFVLTRDDFRSADQDRDDLDVRSNLTIRGAGRNATVVDANAFQGIQVASGVTATIRDLTVRRSAAASADYVRAGIANAGTLSLSDVTIAYAAGTGLLNGGTVTAQRVVVRDAWGYGGIANSGTLELVASHVVGNRVEPGDLAAGVRYAGGLTNLGGTVVVRLGSIVDNRATDDAMAGGVLNDGGSVWIENSTISGNAGGREGGGVLTTGAGAVTTLLSSTVTDNEAAVSGGGLARLAGSFRVEASIVAGNRDLQGDARSFYPDCFGAFTSWGYNLVGHIGTFATTCSGFTATGDRVGTVAAPIDARLGALVPAGSGVVTVVHPLLVGSPAVDGGALGIDEACLAIDQRGVPRPVDGDGNGLTHCDVGAYEAPRARADLAASLAAAPASVVAGGTVDLTAEVRNLGPYIANGATATLVLPNGFGLVSAAGGCTHAAGTVTCALGNLASGAVVQRAVRVAAAATPGSYRATVRATSNSVDPAAGNDAGDVDVAVTAPVADLAAAVEAPAEVGVGDAFGAQAAVRNRGPNVARSVVLVVDVAGATLTSPCQATATPGRWTCGLGDLASGAQRTVALQLAAGTSAGSASITVRATTTTTDPTAANDVAAAEVEVVAVAAAAADLTVEKLGPAAVEPGAALPYALTVRNLGPDGAAGVVVIDEPPAGTTVAALPAGCAPQSGAIVCTVGDLPVGASASFALTLTAPALEGELVNRATARSTTADPNGGNDTAQAVTTVVGGAGAPVGVDVVAATPGVRTSDGGAEVALDVLVVADGASALTGLTLVALGRGDASVGLGQVRVRWLADPTGPAAGADGEELATGVFAAAGAPLELAFAAPLALEAGVAARLVVEVDVVAPEPSTTTSTLASLGALGLVGWAWARRRRGAAVLATLALAATLAACATTAQDGPPPTSTTYQLRLASLDVGSAATVTGLPVLGDVLEVVSDGR